MNTNMKKEDKDRCTSAQFSVFFRGGGWEGAVRGMTKASFCPCLILLKLSAGLCKSCVFRLIFNFFFLSFFFFIFFLFLSNFFYKKKSEFQAANLAYERPKKPTETEVKKIIRTPAIGVLSVTPENSLFTQERVGTAPD